MSHPRFLDDVVDVAASSQLVDAVERAHRLQPIASPKVLPPINATGLTFPGNDPLLVSSDSNGGHLEQAGNPSDPHSFFKPGFPRTVA
jgi:hypothetical protein